MEDLGKAREDWFKTFLSMPKGIPSHDTFNRVFAALDPVSFLDCFLSWTQSLRQAVAQEIVALDGKALRRALNGDQGLKVVDGAWAAGTNRVLGQNKVDDKSHEITALPQLLRLLELSGCFVTVCAVGCQKKIARESRDADADYLLSLGKALNKGTPPIFTPQFDRILKQTQTPERFNLRFLRCVRPGMFMDAVPPTAINKRCALAGKVLRTLVSVRLLLPLLNLLLDLR